MAEERNRELLALILDDQSEKELEDQELIRLLLEQKVSRDTHAAHQDKLSLGGRMADAIARFVGSWTFILFFISALVLWIVANALLAGRAADPYPFILLNLILSCVAAIQAPVIMMSQNRQEEKDRLRSMNDYKINLKSEIILEDLYRQIGQIAAAQEEMLRKLEALEQEGRSGERQTDRGEEDHC